MHRHSLRTALVLITVVLAMGSTTNAGAVAPPRPGEMAKLRRENRLVHASARANAFGLQRVDAGLVSDFAGAEPTTAPFSSSAAASLSGWPLESYRAISSTGVINIPVIIIDFPDHPAAVSVARYAQLLAGPGSVVDAPYDSLREYYARSSYGTLDLRPEVLGVYHCPTPRSSIAQDSASQAALLGNALASFDARVDYSKFDNDGDGALDYCIFFWSGPAGEWASFWWGYYTGGWVDGSFDGKRLGMYSWQWEPSGQGFASVVIHETGHALGLPDYYDYDDSVGPRGGVGPFDIMGGNGDHGAFSKWMLGWLEPRVIDKGGEPFTLRPSSDAPDAAVVMPRFRADEPFKEFFLVQVRRQAGNDTTWPYTPEPRLQVWHVDATLAYRYGASFRYDNSFSRHKLLRLMEADGLEHIESSGAGHPEDLFAMGSMLRDEWSPGTAPYRGTTTGISIGRIAPWADGLSFAVSMWGDDVDTVAPVTSLAAPSGWTNAPVTIGQDSLTVQDSSPIAITFVRVRHATSDYTRSTESGVPTTLRQEGSYTVGLRSIDECGNEEAERTQTLGIDLTAPESNASIGPTYVSRASLGIAATDALSGVHHVSWRLDGGAWSTATTLVCSQVGSHQLDFFATDNAGNAEPVQTAYFRVAHPSLTRPRMSHLTGRTVVVSGTLWPSHAAGARPVVLTFWRYTHGRWVKRATRTPITYTLGSRSAYRVLVKLPSRGRWRVVASHAAHDEQPAVKSSAAYVRF